jgi:hypothetical protein
MRRFYLYGVMLSIGLIVGALLTERRYHLEQQPAEPNDVNDPAYTALLIDTQIKRAMHPQFDRIMRNIEEKSNHE